MQEVAEATPRARGLVVVPTTGLAKVCDWRELNLKRSSVVVATVHGLQGIARHFFVLEPNIDMANEMVGNVVDDVQFQNAPILAELEKEIFVDREEILTSLLLIDRTTSCCSSQLSLSDGMLIDVFDKESCGKGGFVVLSRAAVEVATGSDLEVERAVHLVLLCSVDGGEMTSHASRLW